MANDPHGFARLEDDGEGGKQLVIVTMRKQGAKMKELKRVYKLEDIHPDERVAKPAYNLTTQEGEIYHVSVNEFGPACTCPDGHYRRENDRIKCKHVKAMQAVGLLPAEPTYGREEPPEETPIPW